MGLCCRCGHNFLHWIAHFIFMKISPTHKNPGMLFLCVCVCQTLLADHWTLTHSLSWWVVLLTNSAVVCRGCSVRPPLAALHGAGCAPYLLPGWVTWPALWPPPPALLSPAIGASRRGSTYQPIGWHACCAVTGGEPPVPGQLPGPWRPGRTR